VARAAHGGAHRDERKLQRERWDEPREVRTGKRRGFGVGAETHGARDPQHHRDHEEQHAERCREAE
jgi:hypothetical protein